MKYKDRITLLAQNTEEMLFLLQNTRRLMAVPSLLIKTKRKMTKTFTLSALLILSCFLGLSQENKLIGKWANTTENGKGEQFEFKANKTAYMIKEGIPSPTFHYKFDANKSPNWIDLEVKADDFEMTMQGLIEFIDEDTVKLELFPEDEIKHPSKFTPIEASSTDVAYVILKRM